INPITGIAEGCPRAASGQTAAAPAIPVMNSRRRIAFTKGFATDEMGFGARLHGRSCPLWVKSRHCSESDQCPVYPRKRTVVTEDGMSVKRQNRPFCAAAKNVVIRSPGRAGIHKKSAELSHS